MSVSLTIASDRDLADLSSAVQTEVIEAMDDVLLDSDRTAPVRVQVNVDAELVEDADADLEDLDGPTTSDTGVVEVHNGP